MWSALPVLSLVFRGRALEIVVQVSRASFANLTRSNRDAGTNEAAARPNHAIRPPTAIAPGERATLFTAMEQNYSAPESWLGSYYELAIEISTTPDDERLRAGVDRLWSASVFVGGPWPDKLATRDTVLPQLPREEEMAASYGLLRIRDLGVVRCVAWIIRETGRGSDWVDLCIPTAALEPFGLAYPLVSESLCDLIKTIDRTLLEVAVHVFAAMPFQLAVIGEEVSGMWSSATVTPEDLAQGGFLLPQQLARQLGARTAADDVAPGLSWVPNRCEERFEKISDR
jgi:hypothetical protein